MPDTAERSRFRATIAYDGTAFHGSQLQPDVRTVQGEVESALSELFDGRTRIDLAGRTDTGVHAAAQEIAFDAPERWDADELTRALNAVLPDDIGLRGLSNAATEFHPRFDATARRYAYIVALEDRGRPFLRDRCWSVDLRLDAVDVPRLLDVTSGILGRRSFEAFSKAGQPERGTECQVEWATWGSAATTDASPTPLLVFGIVADRFLHHMVRYIVGTAMEIATGRRPEKDFEYLLEGREASRPVFPAPPAGLYLCGVRYGDEWNHPGGFDIDMNPSSSFCVHLM